MITAGVGNLLISVLTIPAGSGVPNSSSSIVARSAAVTPDGSAFRILEVE